MRTLLLESRLHTPQAKSGLFVSGTAVQQYDRMAAALQLKHGDERLKTKVFVSVAG